MDDRIIEAASTILGCSYDKAEQFLNSETGCYADIDGRNVWMCGNLIREICEATLEL
jgi:hypothetical protein